MPELPRVRTTTSDATAPKSRSVKTMIATNFPALAERFSGA